jgi:hypothetical protein
MQTKIASPRVAHVLIVTTFPFSLHHNFFRTLQITTCLFQSNVATFEGGALWLSYSTSTITLPDQCIFADNTVSGSDGGGGGACYVSEGALLDLGSNTVMTNNTAPVGSAITAVNGGQVEFGSSATITDNVGSPALSIDGGSLVMGKVGSGLCTSGAHRKEAAQSCIPLSLFILFICKAN